MHRFLPSIICVLPILFDQYATPFSIITPELVYDRPTSHGRPPFCYLTVSKSSERLHNQMWLHRLDVISLSIMSGRNNMRYIYILNNIYMCALWVKCTKATFHMFVVSYNNCYRILHRFPMRCSARVCSLQLMLTHAVPC